MSDQKRVPLLLLPFWAIWKLLEWILGLTGRLIVIVLGVALMIVGAVLTLTIALGIIGIPLIILGFLLVIRGLF